MEVYVQVTVQVLVLLLSRTDTPTTGGLTTIFNQDFLGLNPYAVLGKNLNALKCKVKYIFKNTFDVRSINLLEYFKLCTSAYKANSS